MILNIPRHQCSGFQPVKPVLYRLLTAGNHGTGQVGTTFDLELKTAIAGLNTGLLVDAGVITLGFAVTLAGTGGAGAGTKRRNAQADASAGAAVFGLIGAAIL